MSSPTVKSLAEKVEAVAEQSDFNEKRLDAHNERISKVGQRIGAVQERIDDTDATLEDLTREVRRNHDALCHAGLNSWQVADVRQILDAQRGKRFNARLEVARKAALVFLLVFIGFLVGVLVFG